MIQFGLNFIRTNKNKWKIKHSLKYIFGNS